MNKVATTLNSVLSTNEYQTVQQVHAGEIPQPCTAEY